MSALLALEGMVHSLTSQLKSFSGNGITVYSKIDGTHKPIAEVAKAIAEAPNQGQEMARTCSTDGGKNFPGIQL
jgi:hypothetical protein